MQKIIQSGDLRRKPLQNRYTGLFYVLPWVIGFLIFQLYPFIMSLYYSFTNYNMIKAPYGWG